MSPAPLTSIFMVPFGPKLLDSTSCRPRAALVFSCSARAARATSAFGFSVSIADIVRGGGKKEERTGGNQKEQAEKNKRRRGRENVVTAIGGCWGCTNKQPKKKKNCWKKLKLASWQPRELGASDNFSGRWPHKIPVAELSKQTMLLFLCVACRVPILSKLGRAPMKGKKKTHNKQTKTSNGLGSDSDCGGRVDGGRHHCGRCCLSQEQTACRQALCKALAVNE